MAPLWYPLVWGRTRRIDTWWRVLPAGLDREGWAADVVTAVFAGGVDLVTPRFLLARLHGKWVTGVACRAADLDGSMAAEEHGRPLFAFVGWAADASADPVLPDLADWEASYVAWASPTYRRWVGLDWELHVVEVRGPHEATSEAVGWAGTERAEAEPLVRASGRVQLVPDADRYDIWRSGMVTREPFVLAVGWTDQSVIDPALLTHAAVGSLTEPTELAAPSGGSGFGLESDPQLDADIKATVDLPTDASADSDHERSPARGLRQFLFGNLLRRIDELLRRIDELLRRVDALEREVNALQAEMAQLRARLHGDDSAAVAASPVDHDRDESANRLEDS